MLYIENAKESFASAGSMFGDNNSECELYHRLAAMIPDKLDVDSLILAFKIALQDADKEGEDIHQFIALVPQYVRQCSSPEFAHEFRKKYNKEILGLTQEELPDVDYGYEEINPDVIDISNKDRNEVLAALYNASTPIGMGFFQYNPMTWTKEIAEMYFEKYGKPNNNGSIVFDYVMGRPLKCIFSDNLVFVANYNNDNEPGLAQRAIATCPNVNQENSVIKR